MTKPVILTGLRANNNLHIGNYLGALLPLIDMAQTKTNDYQVNLFVPDLHSFTTPIDHSTLYDQVIQNLQVYVAAGLPLEHADVHIYRQSYVSAHSELTWILDCFTGMGEMGRMTQYKDRVAKLGDDRLSVGLFNYPVLMATDILLYGASYVPVGDDQSQHIEFARDVAERLNTKFGELFVVPKSVKEQHAFFGKDQGLRIRDLVDPTKKMSKSDESGKGVIFMSDTPDAARKKIMAATTDSIGKITYDIQTQPGVTNLLDLLALFGGQNIETVRQSYEGNDQYGPLKLAVANAVTGFLGDFQAKLAKVDKATILTKLEADEVLMNQQANTTLLKVQRAIGLRPKKKSEHQHADKFVKPAAINFDDFAKLDIRFCTVLSAEHATDSDKLLKLVVQDGNGERQIMTATREFFPDLTRLVGKQLPVIMNLAPRTMRGHESNGMFLCADVNGQPVLVTPEAAVPDGSPLM